MEMKSNIVQILPLSMRIKFKHIQKHLDEVREIRIRVNSPVTVMISGKEVYLGNQGEFLEESREAWWIRAEEIGEIINQICGFSPYAFYEEIKKGYITLPGGHRIGVAGQVLIEDERVAGMKNIRFLNIRISHEVLGAANDLLPCLYEGKELLNTLLISPPGFGKTTLLRDLIRQVSDGNACAKGQSVAVVDERSEIAGCYLGVPQNNVGKRTDVLDGCLKRHGMMMLIRSMAPRVVAIDELGTKEDVDALKQVVHCGSRILVTMHGCSFEEIKQKPFAKELIEEQYFKRYVVLKGLEGKKRKFELFDEEGKICLR